MKRIILFLIPAIVLLLSANPCQGNSADFQEAARNGQLANEGFRRCTKYVHDWLKYSDPTTGLIPGNLSNDRDIWNVHNAAADNYPFMVLTAAITDAPLFKGRMLDMLKTEEEVTSRLGHLPDAYSFSKKTFQDERADNERILFGASEYVKDGLLPLTEWLGESPWSERMFDLIDDTWAHAAIPTKYGLIPSKNVEVNGEQLQVLSRVYWMTRERKYLDWAIRLGDYYLLDHQHPTRDFDVLRLRNHGCEIVSGLCELYVTVHFASQEKKKQYEQPIHEMLNRILEIGRNEDGMFYNSVNPKTGQTIDEGISDTWGYVFNAFYTVYLIDKTDAYRDAILLALSHLNRYRNFDWEQGAADGFADAIEGAINLYNREALSHVKEWIDGETKILWSLQDTSYRKEAQQWKNTGIIDGSHCDGNFARTTLMYCLWKTQGVTVSPWRKDVVFGAVYKNDELFMSIKVDRRWEGKILFDRPRHQTVMRMPLDWPRINQFPEWFTINPDSHYEINNLNDNSLKKYNGSDLENGVFLKLDPGVHYRLKVTKR